MVLFWKVVVVALVAALPMSRGHCDNNEPRGVASGFRFDDPTSPDVDDEFDYDVTFFDDKVIINQDVDAFATGREACTHVDSNGDPNPFYDVNFPISADIDGDGINENVFCGRALRARRENDSAAINAIEAIISPATIPNDQGTCCNSYRFRQNKDIGAVDIVLDEDLEVQVTVNIEEGLGGDAVLAKRFAELCEEYFICQKYIEFSDREECLSTGTSRCPRFTQRSLCFEDFYEPGGGKERDVRSSFVVADCWGVGGNPDFGEGAGDGQDFRNPLPAGTEGRTSIQEIMYNLETNVESSCNLATSRSEEARYVPTPTCLDLITCRKDEFPPDVDQEVRDSLDKKAFDICGEMTDAELQDLLNACNAPDITAQRAEYPFTELCPDIELKDSFVSFPPDYPDDNNDDPDYRSNILGVVGADFNSRTDAAKLGNLKISTVALKGVNIVAEGFRDALPEEPFYTFKNIAWSLSSVAVEVLEAIITKFDFHDGNIDGAEVEAIYENSRQLLDGSAAVYDAVRCRKTLVDDSDLLPAKWGQGCDSVDNDCDRIVDECNEDRIDPVIDTSLAAAQCSQQWFNTVADAQACVDATVTAVDDCDPDVTINSAVQPATTCADTTFDITATTARCTQTSSTTFKTKVDTIPPTVTCLLGGLTDTVLEATGANVLEDVGLSYSVISPDGCVNDVNVTVKVFANEIENFHNQQMAVLYRTKNSPDDKVGLYVAKGLCETANNGQCIKDPAVKSKGRLYTVKVAAVDEAGNMGVGECSALILPSNLARRGNSGFANAQRFLLTSYTQVILA